MKILYIYLISSLFLLTSCFEKDERQPPYVWNGESYTLTESMYTHQVYYNFSTNTTVAENLVTSWDLAFEATPRGWHIRVNTGNFLAAQNLHITDISSTSYTPDAGGWVYDASSGETDSLAISNWVDTSGTAYTYTGDVYLIGQHNGISYSPYKRVSFTGVDDTSYTFNWADQGSTMVHQALVHKAAGFNYQYFSFTQDGGTQVDVEPPRDSWDIVFTQYTTTLYTDAGVPTPYFVRGTLLNPYQTEAFLDTSMQFDMITLLDVQGFAFSNASDYIGHDWKKVTVDEGSGQATYEVRNGYNYLIHNSKDEYFKMKFVAYYDSIGNPGYPSFEFIKLN